MKKIKRKMKDTIILIFISMGATAGALIPFWIYLFAKWEFVPDGFWQNFVLFGFVLGFLGFFQLVLFVLLIIFLCIIWK